MSTDAAPQKPDDDPAQLRSQVAVLQELLAARERQLVERTDETVVERRLNLALDATHMGAWDLDLLHDRAWRSLRHDRVFGYDTLLPEWGFEIFLTHVVPEDRELVQKNFADAFATDQFNMDCRVRWPDRSIHWITAQGHVYRNEKGEPSRMMGLVTNIDARKQLEESLAQRIQELDRSNSELRAAHLQADRIFSAFAKALPGTVLDGKYRLEEELGSGGFGAVFRGRHLVLDCPIAIKVFRPIAGNDSANALERFKQEGRAASCIDHPNAVRVLDSGVSTEGVAYLIMELLRGRSLFQELATTGPLSLRRAASIASRVADVLAASHRQGLVHRDIKPDNIFLHNTDAGEVVKVVDFGIAKFFGDLHETRAVNLTRADELIGTPSFVAPERIQNKPDDGRSDVFSLGAVLYEMICGCSPWTRKQLFAMVADEGSQQLPRPMSTSRRGVPPALVAVVQRALSWDSAERLTASELAGELDGLVDRLDDSRPQMTVEAPVKEMTALWTQA